MTSDGQLTVEPLPPPIVSFLEWLEPFVRLQLREKGGSGPESARTGTEPRVVIVTSDGALPRYLEA